MQKLILLCGILSTCSCNENIVNPGPQNASIDTTSHKESDMNLPSDAGLYSIALSDTVVLSLQQWDTTVDLQRYLGKPLNQKQRQLDRNSDTFSGSFIKELDYNGLTLQLFSPPQNGKTFWLREIILTNEKFKTSKGIGLGDDLQKVKQYYTSVKEMPGGNGNIYHVKDERDEKSIEMEFQDNKVKKLRMIYTLN